MHKKISIYLKKYCMCMNIYALIYTFSDTPHKIKDSQQTKNK